MIYDKFGMDKVAHFSMSAFLALSFSCFLPLWASVPIVLALGIGKEVYDRKNTGLFDKKDLVADVLGTMLGAGVWLLTLL